jgi:ubiquitin carboxyl-terminal hydrolase 8
MSKNKLNGGYTYGSNMSNPFNEEYIDLNPSQITRTNSINYSDLESNNEENNTQSQNEDELNQIKTYVKDNLLVLGLTGFVNQGNTCYLNCVLQCLMSTEYLIPYFIKKEFDEILTNNQMKYILKKKEQMGINIKITKSILEHTKKNTITFDFYNLMSKYWEEKGRNITPKSIKKRIGKISVDFSGSKQNDSEEALNIILDNLHEELLQPVNLSFKKNEKIEFLINILDSYSLVINNEDESDEKKILFGILLNEFYKTNLDNQTIIKSYLYWKNYLKNNYSIIKEVFGGLYISKVKCGNCGNYNCTFDPFDSIQLQLPEQKNLKLEDCLDNFFKIELLNNDNKYNCEKCNIKVDAIKQIEFWYLPKVLIIQLKRFEAHSFFSKKKNDHVECLFNISLEKYCCNISDCKDYNYELYSVCNHYGGTTGGHYTANVKNPINNLWYEFNDDSIYHIDISNVITESAYLLFYKKI